MLDHYDLRGGGFCLGIRPAAGRKAGFGLWRVVKAVLESAADLDAHVYGARLCAQAGRRAPS